MANISKNIKRVRAAKKLTQEQLAAQLNVTRQTVSSWETDRTQPDIDMLAALAAALDTDIEDLIYGKHKHVGLEPDPAEKRRTLSLVLIIMGCLLFAVGVIFLFVYFWREVPGFLKKALALLPLLAGVGAGLYTLLRKKESVPFREGAAVLWYAGVIASNALINSMFAVDFGFERLLIADTLLLLPVPFLLDSVFAFTAEFALSMVLIWRQVTDNATGFPFIFGAAVLAALAAYLFGNGQIKPVKQFCAWLWLLGAGAAAAGGAMLLFITLQERLHVTSAWEILLFASALFCFFLALFVTGREKRFDLRFTLPAGAALTASLPVFTALAFIDDGLGELFGYDTAGYAVLLPLTLLFLVPAFAAGKAENRGNKIKLALIAVFCAFYALQLLSGKVNPYLSLAFSVAAGVLVVAAGVKRGRLLICNFGMLQIAANVFILLADLRTADFLWIGATFIVMGAAFLVINRIMIKKFEARKAAQAALNAAQAPEAPSESEVQDNA